LDYGSVGVANFPQAWWNPIVSYQSDKKKLRKEKTPIEANLCLDCGHLEFGIENVTNLVK
jgi:hypothetical protein